MCKLPFPTLFLAFFVSVSFAQPPAERPYDVPDINGMAVSLVKPAFPETAVAADADGATSLVRVVVDENGSPVSATCSLNCHAMLKDAAELAAMQSKFKPLIKDGKAVRYQGTLQFTFVVSRVDWFRFATALESTRQFDNISLGPVAQMLSKEYAKEKASLAGLDANGGADYETRQKVIAEVASSVKSKLVGTDLWRYEMGMALRRVTFWTQAGEAINRAELQKSIDALAPVIASAPEGVSADLINGLTQISKYRLPAEITERDLRQAIGKMAAGLAPHLR